MIEPHAFVGTVTLALAGLIIVSAWMDAEWLRELRVSRWGLRLGGQSGRRLAWLLIGFGLLAASLWIFYRGPQSHA